MIGAFGFLAFGLLGFWERDEKGEGRGDGMWKGGGD